MAETSNSMMAPAGTDPRSGDLNAGFAFFLDCVVNLFVLSGILVGAFAFPTEIVFGRIIPGAIVGILAGNVAFVLYARKLARDTGAERITAIPLGIDLPTVFGICFFVLGPVFTANKAALGDLEAATLAWQIGIAAALWMAAFKLVFSFVGRAMQDNLPPIALIGTMAGIATVWLGAEAFLGVFELPEVGLVALAIMAFSLISGHKLPFNMPGAVLAIVLGTVIFYFLALTGLGDGYVVPKAPALTAALPMPTLGGFGQMFDGILPFIGIVLPFALLIATSSVNVVAGAKVVGDIYDPAKVVRIDAGVTALSALFGGVVQTTPYFGHPTYKRMGAGTLYSLGAASVIALGGFAGVIAFASVMVPSAVLKPILMVVASDIIRLAFTAGSTQHAPAVLFALIPAILNYAYTKLSDLFGRLATDVQLALGSEYLANMALLGTLSRGYILASLIWGTLIVWIIDKRLVRAAYAAFFASIMTAFGVIHSVLPSSGMYLPWDIPAEAGIAASLSLRMTMAYGIVGLLLLVLHAVQGDATPEASDAGTSDS